MELLRQRRNGMPEKLPTEESLLDEIEKEGLLGEFLTIRQEGSNLQACDPFRHQRLEMARKEDGSVRPV